MNHAFAQPLSEMSLEEKSSLSVTIPFPLHFLHSTKHLAKMRKAEEQWKPSVKGISSSPPSPKKDTFLFYFSTSQRETSDFGMVGHFHCKTMPLISTTGITTAIVTHLRIRKSTRKEHPSILRKQLSRQEVTRIPTHCTTFSSAEVLLTPPPPPWPQPVASRHLLSSSPTYAQVEQILSFPKGINFMGWTWVMRIYLFWIHIVLEHNDKSFCCGLEIYFLMALIPVCPSVEWEHAGLELFISKLRMKVLCVFCLR